MADLTILCKVVDNFGDIGFVYRLAKNLVQLNPRHEIRIAVDNLEAFNKIEPRVNTYLAEQDLEVACENCLQALEGQGNGCKPKTENEAKSAGKPEKAAETENASKTKKWGRLRIFDATNAAVCAREWTKKPPRVILECFQCGRPDWLEEILFGGAEKRDEKKFEGKTETATKNACKFKNAPLQTKTDCKTTTLGAKENCVQGQDARALIINIDYLTAEDYAEEFHCLKSGTRSVLVRKVNFMPGFSAKTGGLILDAAAKIVGKTLAAKKLGAAIESATIGQNCLQIQRAADKNRLQAKDCASGENAFLTKTAGAAETCCPAKNAPQILMFSYPKNFTPIIRAILRWKPGAQINLAQGAGKESFLQANAKLAHGQNAAQNESKAKTAGADGNYLQDKNVARADGKSKTAGETENESKTKSAGGNCLQAQNAGDLFVRELPFLPQEEWDKNLYKSDILFVRGEDSLSRACLSAKPFVWQAYLQDDDYQLVKVRALLERMRPHFAPKDFCALENFWLLYNKSADSGDFIAEKTNVALAEKNGLKGQKGAAASRASAMEEACFEFLSRSDSMKAGFESFARSLFDLGNFSERLLEFIEAMA